MRTQLVAIMASALLAAACSVQSDRAVQSTTPSNDAWVAQTSIYEVFVRDFSPDGNFRGVTAGLEDIQAVGAEVVWLMPIHPIGELERKGSYGSPYSIADYRGINPDFGTADDFRELVRAVHARDMKLIIDWVPNHTAWDHHWVRDQPDYYTRDEAGSMTVPRDNDGNLTDWTDVVELDYENPAVRRAMIGEMTYWLKEFDIDGFRVDVAGMVPDAFWREAIPELRAAGATLLLAEWGDVRMHDLGFDLTYAWDSYHRLKAVWRGEPASSYVQGELDELRGMPDGGLRLRFTTNHDETAWDAPPVVLFGGVAGARAAFVAAALLPGVPLLYNGQEVESPQVLGLFERESVDWELSGADSARAFYRRVIMLARTNAAFTADEFAAVDTDAGDDVIAFRRGGFVVLVNARPEPVRLEVPGIDIDGAVDLLHGGDQSGDVVVLEPYGTAVLELRIR
jgi:glycosidase